MDVKEIMRKRDRKQKKKEEKARAAAKEEEAKARVASESEEQEKSASKKSSRKASLKDDEVVSSKKSSRKQSLKEEDVPSKKSSRKQSLVEETEKVEKVTIVEEKAPTKQDSKCSQSNVNLNEIDVEYFSEVRFDELPLDQLTLKAIAELGFEKTTEIQARSIPHMLNGKDVLGAAKTGSGKTLAYMVPAVELLRRASFKP